MAIEKAQPPMTKVQGWNLSLLGHWSLDVSNPLPYLAIEPALAHRFRVSAAGRMAPGPVSAMVPAGTVRGDQIAVINVIGVLEKRTGQMGYELDSASTTEIQTVVEAAARNPNIAAILLRVDSPGGSVDGLAQLGDAILAARSQKPVWAQVTGVCASAGYYLASQADKVFAQRMDVIGSIGSRMLLYDWSAFFAEAGIKPVPIDTGPYKSMGAAGTEITEAHKAFLHEFVGAYFADFLAVIQRGRPQDAEKLRAIADGRFWTADEALGLGLIDGIQTFDVTLAQLQDVVSQSVQKTNSNPRSHAMADTPSTSQTQGPKAATIHDLKRAFPDARPEFVMAELDRDATLEQAAEAYKAAIQKENLDLREKLATAAKEIEAAKTAAAAVFKKPGVPALGGGTAAAAGAGGDPIEEWNAALEAKIAAGKPRQKAVLEIVNANPQLHADYVAAWNAKHGRPRGALTGA